MSCCGKKRTDWMQELPVSDNNNYFSTEAPRNVSKEKRLFEYTGNDMLIARGVITGKSYYFKYPGAQVAVHPEDAHAFMAEPHLTLISKR